MTIIKNLITKKPVKYAITGFDNYSSNRNLISDREIYNYIFEQTNKENFKNDKRVLII